MINISLIDYFEEQTKCYTNEKHNWKECEIKKINDDKIIISHGKNKSLLCWFGCEPWLFSINFFDGDKYIHNIVIGKPPYVDFKNYKDGEIIKHAEFEQTNEKYEFLINENKEMKEKLSEMSILLKKFIDEKKTN